jgi:hexosaminidase
VNGAVNESASAGATSLPAGVIHDAPRFAWRGLMLDVARHFFSVADVKRVIDLMALYKLNRLHLHLTDDQGWRIMINSWPRLATYGGSTAVGGGAGGYL